MLKTKPLNQLLSQSLSPHVSSALLFTPSGSLLATGTSPTAPDAKKARTHAALAANIWSTFDRSAPSATNALPSTSSSQLSPSIASISSLPSVSSASATPASSDNDTLKSLTLELSDCNLHIQLVAPGVLLCLIGPKTGQRQTSSRSSAHSQDLNVPGSGNGGSPIGSVAARSGTGSLLGSARTAGGSQGGALGVLKTQANGLVEYLERELEGFELPEGL
ncbi:hypothetical protein FPQ18DRAFT_303457 [Pyronema domesticum]|uniref:Roadblock/LAMTOR2 domain-containing protein n=1 Tax=Pyronema omphalodes (strain CBS 100304) TaxID=1076935 RepID=U4KYA0_PYROM|nr:hypothetical protein FPQ18DRAFT_303457 [Pyronema domesticum]CCX06505.1 Similar to hypothetical protein AOL_s00004g401 [Arthrobotrys oligospora ATCC 24927]; acc. no. EGX53742 [Pyronema omphalodes CBS 100304]